MAQEVDGMLVVTRRRIELESDGYRLSYADSDSLTTLVYELGAFDTAEAAVERLQSLLSSAGH